MLLMLVIGFASAVLGWDALVAESARYGMGESTLIAIYAATVAIMLLLLWLIARRGSNVARWIWVVLCVGGLAVSLWDIGAMSRMALPDMLMQAAQGLLTIVSIWLLFRPDANAWFARSGGGEVGAGTPDGV
ncbi:MAG TPA: hypothetical protein VEW25_00855 [Allosphingosinicella sp.]|nr:hypothetical protein [Allosphingosinicella sp.]